MVTLAGYLNLIDSGVSGAANRLLIECKDDRNGGKYGGLIKTSFLVFLIQGVGIFLTVLFFSKTFAHALVIPENLTSDFLNLFVIQGGVIAMGFITRIFGVILGAHQRLDICNYSGALGLMLNFITQWCCFHLGYGVLSLAFGMLIGSLISILMQIIASQRLNVLPTPGCWGPISWINFKELFHFSKDLLLSSVGTSLIRASPSIVITRELGLEFAAAWGVGTRAFTLLNQIIWKITDMSGGAFAEMMVRGENARLYARYSTLATLSFSMAGWVAISFAFTNSLFILIWTHSKIVWSMENDCLLGILMIISSVVHCHNYFILNTRKIAMLPYVYLLEGSVFVALSIFLVRWGGITAIIVCSIVCSIIFSGSYGVFRVSRYFTTTIYEVAVKWLNPMLKMMLWYAPSAVLLWWILAGYSASERFVIQIVNALIVGGPLLLYFCISINLKEEICYRVPYKIRPLVSKMLFYNSSGLMAGFKSNLK